MLWDRTAERETRRAYHEASDRFAKVVDDSAFNRGPRRQCNVGVLDLLSCSDGDWTASLVGPGCRKSARQEAARLKNKYERWSNGFLFRHLFKGYFARLGEMATEAADKQA